MLAAVIIFLVITGTLAWLYIFSIYEVEYSVKSVNTGTGTVSYSIEPLALNSFGVKAPYRSVRSKYSIVGGKSLVSNYFSDGINAEFTISSIPEEKVVIIAESDYSLFPTKLEIE